MKIVLLFVMMLLAGTSLMAQKNKKEPRTAESVLQKHEPLKGVSIGNMSAGKAIGSEHVKGTFVSPTGVNIEWRALYSPKTKEVTMLVIETERPQSAAFWNAQIAALDSPETFKALEACLTKDDAKNFAPCMQATVQSKMK